MPVRGDLAGFIFMLLFQFMDNEDLACDGQVYDFRGVVGAPDAEGNGVLDANDACPGTVIPESVPTQRLGVNRFTLANALKPREATGQAMR